MTWTEKDRKYQLDSLIEDDSIKAAIRSDVEFILGLKSKKHPTEFWKDKDDKTRLDKIAKRLHQPRTCEDTQFERRFSAADTAVFTADQN